LLSRFISEVYCCHIVPGVKAPTNAKLRCVELLVATV